MTLAAVPRKAGPYAGTGSQVAYAYNFRIETANDVLVYQNRDVVPQGAYQVTGVQNDAGGTVLYTGAQGSTIWIFGNLPIEQQDISLQNPGAPIVSSRLELFGDKSVMREWERQEFDERCLAFHQASSLRNIELPTFAGQGLKLFQINATEDGIDYADAAIVQVTVDPVSGLSYLKASQDIPAVAGNEPLKAAGIFPAGTEPLALTARLLTNFGVSAGLTALAIGDEFEGYDVWAPTMGITTPATINVGQRRLQKVLANASARDVIISPLGGNFDNVGSVRITAHYFTATPD